MQCFNSGLFALSLQKQLDIFALLPVSSDGECSAVAAAQQRELTLSVAESSVALTANRGLAVTTACVAISTAWQNKAAGQRPRFSSTRPRQRTQSQLLAGQAALNGPAPASATWLEDAQVDTETLSSS